MNKKPWLLIIAFSCVTVWLTACDGLFPTPIGKILQSPREYAGKEVQVSGSVVEIFSIVFIKYFVVQDSTGELAIVTDRPLPRKGEKIKVRGKIEEAFSLGDQQMLVLIENSANNNSNPENK